MITFSNLTFSVPGAAVQLHGTYKLRDQALDFMGELRLKAKLRDIRKTLTAEAANR